MDTAADYVLRLKIQLLVSPVVASFNIIAEKVWPDRGYIRVRCVLTNGDLLEAAEYFVCEGGKCRTERYRYQWMKGETRCLRKRWDNVEHYPGLPNFPHHIHTGRGEVLPGERMSIIQLLDILGQEIAQGA